MTQFFLGLTLIAVAAILGFYGTQLAREGWTRSKGATEHQAEQPSKPSEEIAALDKRIEKLSDVLTRSPSVDSQAQLDILKDEHDKLAEKKDELTKQDKQSLNDQAITLESLESARKKAAEKLELEKRQNEIAQRQAEINRENALKESKKILERQERDVAERMMPIYQSAVTTLYEKLKGVAEQSSKAINSDFPGGDRPAFERSRLVKDGKLVGGEEIIRLGSDKEWEFHVLITGTPEQMQPQPAVGLWRPYFTAFKIQAGDSYVTITAPRPMARQPYLSIAFVGAPGSQGAGGESSFIEYQKPIQQALTALIYDRYNAKPLKPKSEGAKADSR